MPEPATDISVNAPPDPTPSVVLVLTTVGVAADAVAIARTLVEERLAACVHVLPPMISVYRWKDQVEEDRERQIVMKTTRERVGALEARLRALHPYELPEFLIVQADGGSDAYLAWVIENVRPVKRT
jgi:periplasmic divalent cation tolerance protein